MKVLHAPCDVGGNAWQLSRAERELGVDSDVMVYRKQWFGYPNDIDLEFERGSLPAKLWRSVRFFGRALRTYDVFHFNAGQSLVDHPSWGLHLADLAVLKRLGKRIVVTVQGCDTRRKENTRARFELAACHHCDVAHCDAAFDAQRERRTAQILRYADRVFALNPDLLHHVPGAEFLPYTALDPRSWKREASDALPSDSLRIAHLPSQRSIKGTRFVVEAVERLRGEGHAIELDLIENVPHGQIKERLCRNHLVIDQLLVGWYGAAAVEAMALEIPVVAYVRKSDLRTFGISFSQPLPIINADPSNLADRLRELLAEPARLAELGRRSRAYVEEVHDPRAIAARVVESYSA